MAGADGSGEAMQTGRTNRAEGRTKLWADVPSGEPNFDGHVIFTVEVAKTPDDPDDYDEGESFTPSGWLHGIIGSGSSGHVPAGNSTGGVGVIGEGGNNQGTGVVGFGGGGRGTASGATSDEHQREGFSEGGEGTGTGGIGVHGIGGNIGELFGGGAPPGIGVVGRGGRQPDNSNTAQLPHGAGVVALAGGNGRPFPPLPPLADTGSIGVFAQGANAEVVSVPDPTGTSSGQNVPSGPLAPGAGVFGRGGVPVPPRGRVAAGVIGLAGGTTPIPGISETGDSGVYGAGPTGVFGHGPIGVRGQGEGGPGVEGVGMADSSRGGQFESTHAAQVQLVPHETRKPTPPSATVPPAALTTQSEGVQLPKDGRGGDLLTLMDSQRQCTLWFCVRGEVASTHDTVGSPARWAQVLVGPSIAGQA